LGHSVVTTGEGLHLRNYKTITIKAAYKNEHSTYINGLVDHTTTTQVLIFHHLFSMFTFLLRALLEELVESLQSDIIAIKVPGLSAETSKQNNW